MNQIKELLPERLEQLHTLIAQKQNALKSAPEGTLRANQHPHKISYYHRNGNGDHNGKYLKKSESKLIKQLAQKEYDKKLLNTAVEEERVLQKLWKCYAKGDIESVYEKIPKTKRYLMEPFEQDEESYIKQWIQDEYEKLSYHENEHDYYTDRGERVRSKSEILIANQLNRLQVPYHYEKPLRLNNKVVYPDFTILNVSQRKTIYWEHFGLMDDQTYRDNALAKIKLYEECQYFQGDRLIITFETAHTSLGTTQVINLINYFFKA